MLSSPLTSTLCSLSHIPSHLPIQDSRLGEGRRVSWVASGTRPHSPTVLGKRASQTSARRSPATCPMPRQCPASSGYPLDLSSDSAESFSVMGPWHLYTPEVSLHCLGGSEGICPHSQPSSSSKACFLGAGPKSETQPCPFLQSQ